MTDSHPLGATPAEPTAPFNPTGIRWHYLSAQGRAWLEEMTPSGPAGILVKGSVRRSVRRFAGGVYLKEVHYRGWRALAKTLAGGNSCREGAMLRRLAQLGIAVPEVLAFGSERRFGLLRRDVLITAEVESNGSLLQFMQEVYPRLAFPARKRLASDLADFVRMLHDAGVIQRDLHVHNLLVRHSPAGTTFVLLDGQRVAIRARGLTVAERVLNLATLLCNFWTLASTSQCLRFLKLYGMEWQSPSGRHRLYHIKRLALALSRRSWDAHTRQTLTTSSSFIRERRHGFTIHRVRTAETAQIIEEILPDPDRLLAHGEILRDDARVRAARVEIAGNPYVLERYHGNDSSFRRHLVGRRGRAQRIWLTSWGFELRHLPVLAPLICLDRRRVSLQGRSYLLYSHPADAQPLAQVWDHLDESQRQDTIIHIAMQLGRLHRFGGTHGDPNWNHLLVTIHKDRPEITFGGLDNARILQRAGRKKQNQDVRRFLQDLAERDSSRRFQEMFVHAWRNWAG